MTFSAHITISLRPSILDPQGKAVHHAAGQLGFSDVKGVRMGKHAVVEIEADSRDEAERTALQLAEKLLANPVMEDFAVAIREPDTAAA
jgi:phosphoribosylformylglycinamidine synthase